METRDRKSLFLRQTEFALFKSQKKKFFGDGYFLSRGGHIFNPLIPTVGSSF